MIRPSCGTFAGLRLHQEAGEDPCSACLINEASRKAAASLTSELVHGRPSALPRPEDLPVTPEAAARHCRELLEATEPRTVEIALRVVS